jgi:LPS export ABC transporter protein LptC
MGVWIQLVVILATAYYFYFQSDLLTQSPTTKTETQSKEFYNQVMKDIALTEYKLNSTGQKDWTLKAKSAKSDPKDSEWKIQDSEVLLFKNNERVVKILSTTGILNTQTKNFVLKDQVISETLSGYIFKSVGLTYESSNEVFYSEGEIYIEGPNRSTVLQGSSFEGNIAKGKMEITGPIYCEQFIPDYDKPVIRSENASIDIEKRNVKFIGKVLIVIGDMNITAREAEFKYNKEKGDIEALIVKGQVFAAQKNQSASSELLEVRVKEGVFLFQGNPRFVSGENTLVGHEILLYDKGKSVQILKGRVKTESDVNLLEGD